jgi:hypothetical protein
MITANGVTSGPFTFVLGLSTSGGNIPAPLNIQTLQGVPNALLFTGSDIFAKANAAYASTCSTTAPCTVYIPAGRYNASTKLTIPGNTLQGHALILDQGAVIHYTGSDYAVEAGPACYNCTISGGYITGTSAAKGGIKIDQPTQGITIEHVSITGFSSGDGILNAGVNQVMLFNNIVQTNLIGVHLIGQPGFAPNATHIIGNNISFNTRWGIVVGDVTNGFTGGGSSTAIFNTYIAANTLEQNGNISFNVPSPDCSGVSGCGAAIDGFTVGTQFIANYLESNPHGIVLGGLPFTDAGYMTRYGVSGAGNGTSQGAVVTGNFFNIPGVDDVFSNFSLSASIHDNSDGQGSSACGVNVNVGTSIQVGVNFFQTSKPYCIGGVGGALPAGSNIVPLGQINATQSVGVQITNPITNGNPMVWTTDTGNNFLDHLGNWTMTGTASSLGYRLSNTSVTWASGAGNPTGACQAGSIYSNSVGTAGSTFWVCVNSAWVDDK